jgi:transcription elongation GreA/GreB family factor
MTETATGTNTPIGKITKKILVLTEKEERLYQKLARVQGNNKVKAQEIFESIREIENERSFRNKEIKKLEQKEKDCVCFGKTINLTLNGKVKKVILVRNGMEVSEPLTKATMNSPLAKAIVGLKEKDVFSYTVGDKTWRGQILKIFSPPRRMTG